MMTDGTWTRASEAVERFRRLQQIHRADGRVDAEEAAIEARVFAEETQPAVTDAYDNTVIGLAIIHSGVEAQRPQRLLRERAKRLAQVVKFPASDPKEAA